MSSSAIHLRSEARGGDVQAVRNIVASTGFFSEQEIAIAVELIEDRIERGEASDYRFLFVDEEPADTRGGPPPPIAFACFGPIPGTQCGYDLYWIAVRDDRRGGGLGRALMQACERAIREAGGRRVYAETSSRPQYEPTRRFYLGCGYRVDADQKNFYAPGDGKITYVKAL